MCTLDNVIFVKSVLSLLADHHHWEYSIVLSLDHDDLVSTSELGGQPRGDGDQDHGADQGSQQPTTERHAHTAPARPPVHWVKTLLFLLDHDTVQPEQSQSEGNTHIRVRNIWV